MLEVKNDRIVMVGVEGKSNRIVVVVMVKGIQ